VLYKLNERVLDAKSDRGAKAIFTYTLEKGELARVVEE
jgi:hypothetical protein